MRIALGCALAALTGVLATLSFAPYDAWWVVWFAFVPMIVAQYRVLPAQWSSLGPAIGVGGFVFGYVGGAFPAAQLTQVAARWRRGLWQVPLMQTLLPEHDDPPQHRCPRLPHGWQVPPTQVLPLLHDDGMVLRGSRRGGRGAHGAHYDLRACYIELHRLTSVRAARAHPVEVTPRSSGPPVGGRPGGVIRR